MIIKKPYTRREEKANYLTHALGVVVSIVATVVLIQNALITKNSWAVVAFSIFGFGMMVCMLSSTIYHYVQEPTLKAKLRHFDHGSIYLLIASSYSPFTLILLRNKGLWGFGVFALVWIVALVGIGLNFRKLKANNHFKTASYVFMGMLLLVATKPMIEVAKAENCLSALYWMGLSGVFYIIGSFIYALAKREFIHAVFHVFVLLGLLSSIIASSLIPL